MTSEELISLVSKALDHLKTGKSLFGQEGAFAPDMALLKLIYLVARNC